LTFDLEGSLVSEAQNLFEHDWACAGGRTPDAKQPNGEDAQPPFAQLIASGPDQADDTVHNLLVTACFQAQRRIVAVTPYFGPGDVLEMALTLAARRGVQVDLVLPRRSNHRMADFARHRALRDLAGAGAHVWFEPYMNHAKCIVVDDSLALAGSANLDARSLFLNYEMMMAFYEADDVARFAAYIDGHRAAAQAYTARPPGLFRDLAEGLVLWIAFQL
jgi:cardiolipin synthase